MIITKKHLPRRTFLRGLGATLALPLLDAMVPALRALRRPPRSRSAGFGVVYVPNGIDHGAVDAGRRGRGFELHADPAAARAVPRPAGRRERARQHAGDAAGRGRRRSRARGSARS